MPRFAEKELLSAGTPEVFWQAREALRKAAKCQEARFRV